MEKPPENDRSKRSKTQQLTDQEMIGQLGDCILQNLRKELRSEADPFEIYAAQLKVRLHRNNKIFRERLIHGYETLLKALQTMPNLH